MVHVYSSSVHTLCASNFRARHHIDVKKIPAIMGDCYVRRKLHILEDSTEKPPTPQFYLPRCQIGHVDRGITTMWWSPSPPERNKLATVNPLMTTSPSHLMTSSLQYCPTSVIVSSVPRDHNPGVGGPVAQQRSAVMTNSLTVRLIDPRPSIPALTKYDSEIYLPTLPEVFLRLAPVDGHRSSQLRSFTL